MKDYCSFSPDLEHGYCCKQHDIDYTLQRNKFSSDLKLFKCVRIHSGTLIASIYYVAVSTIGWYWYLKSKHKV